MLRKNFFKYNIKYINKKLFLNIIYYFYEKKITFQKGYFKRNFLYGNKFKLPLNQ